MILRDSQRKEGGGERERERERGEKVRNITKLQIKRTNSNLVFISDTDLRQVCPLGLKTKRRAPKKRR